MVQKQEFLVRGIPVLYSIAILCISLLVGYVTFRLTLYFAYSRLAARPMREQYPYIGQQLEEEIQPAVIYEIHHLVPVEEEQRDERGSEFTPLAQGSWKATTVIFYHIGSLILASFLLLVTSLSIAVVD